MWWDNNVKQYWSNWWKVWFTPPQLAWSFHYCNWPNPESSSVCRWWKYFSCINHDCKQWFIYLGFISQIVSYYYQNKHLSKEKIRHFSPNSSHYKTQHIHHGSIECFGHFAEREEIESLIGGPWQSVHSLSSLFLFSRMTKLLVCSCSDIVSGLIRCFGRRCLFKDPSPYPNWDAAAN